MTRLSLLPLLFLTGSCLHSADVLVTNTEDNTDSGSLRWAIEVESNPGDTILFDEELSGKTIFISSTEGELRINKNLTIDGSSLASRLTLSGDTAMDGPNFLDERIMSITSGNVILKSLIFEGGRAADGIDPGDPGEDGGAMRITGGIVTIEDCLFDGNRAGNGQTGDSMSNGGVGGDGGAIYNTSIVTVRRCQFTNNSGGEGGDNPSGSAGAGGRGGAIYSAIESLTIEDSTVSGNSAGSGGAGSTVAGAGGNGGGIANIYSITIERCTISQNNAGDGGAGPTGGTGGSGGGLYSSFSQTATIRNSTFSGNSAGSNSFGVSGANGGNGGGVFATSNLILENCTIIGNEAGDGTAGSGQGGSGGGLNRGTRDTTISNSIIAQNSAGSAGTISGGSPDIRSETTALTTAGINLIGDNSGSTLAFPIGQPNGDNNLVGTSGSPIDPLLDPLGQNGGLTETMIPMLGSPIIDPATGDTTSTLTTDQRGEVRVFGGRVDIGAVEIDPATLTESGNEASVSNLLRKAKLKRKLKKIKKRLRNARKNDRTTKVKRLRDKIRKLRKKIRRL